MHGMRGPMERTQGHASKWCALCPPSHFSPCALRLRLHAGWESNFFNTGCITDNGIDKLLAA